MEAAKRGQFATVDREMPPWIALVAIIGGTLLDTSARTPTIVVYWDITTLQTMEKL